MPSGRNGSQPVAAGWLQLGEPEEVHSPSDIHRYEQLLLGDQIGWNRAQKHSPDFIQWEILQITLRKIMQIWRHRYILIVSCSSRRCDFTESRNEGAHRHPGRQEQPLPVYGSWGETIQLCKSIFFLTLKLNYFSHFLALKRKPEPGKLADLRTIFTILHPFYARLGASLWSLCVNLFLLVPLLWDSYVFSNKAHLIKSISH